MAALTAVTCWSGVTDTPCPNAVVASSTGPIWDSLKSIPDDSPFRSIPVLDPKPKFFIYLNKVAVPSFCPSTTNPGLLGVDFTSKKNYST